MTRRATDRLQDISAAIERIAEMRGRAAGPAAMLHDAIAYNLIMIGEAVRGLPTELTAMEPHISWSGVIALRNLLAHRYFDVDPDQIWRVCDQELPILKAASERLAALVAASSS